VRRLAGSAFWPAAFTAAIVLPFVITSDYFTSIAVLAGLYIAINLMWTLVLGTAGIYSFATLAIVGVAAYAAAYVGAGSRTLEFEQEGWPIWAMLLVAGGIGTVFGLLVAAPAIRLRGVYFALLTFGLVELCRSFVLNSDTFGKATGLSRTNRFVPSGDLGTDRARLTLYFIAMGIAVFALLVYWAIDRGKLGLLLRAARESEPLSRSLGIDVSLARMAVFAISSAVLGLIGGMYTGIYGSISPTIFAFDTLLLLFAMMVVGGLRSDRGVILGVCALLLIDQKLLGLGAMRLIVIGCIMLVIVLFAHGGLAGLPDQIARAVRRRRLRRENKPQAAHPADPSDAQGAMVGESLRVGSEQDQ
jgi:branched-chain amino acid transport system permease protein